MPLVGLPWALESGWPGFEFEIFYSLAWTLGKLASVSLKFLICKIGIILTLQSSRE